MEKKNHWSGSQKITCNSWRNFPNLGLAADIPDREADVLVDDGLHVEADGGDGGDNLAQLQLVEDSRLPGVVEAQHDDPGGRSAEEAVHQGWDQDSHSWSGVLIRRMTTQEVLLLMYWRRCLRVSDYSLVLF